MCPASFYILLETHSLCSWGRWNKRGEKEPTAGFASVATKPQNLDGTGGRRKKYMYLSLGHHSRKRIAFFFFPPLPSFILHQFLDHVEEKVTGDMQILCSHLWKPEIL